MNAMKFCAWDSNPGTQGGRCRWVQIYIKKVRIPCPSILFCNLCGLKWYNIYYCNAKRAKINKTKEISRSVPRWQRHLDWLIFLKQANSKSKTWFTFIFLRSASPNIQGLTSLVSSTWSEIGRGRIPLNENAFDTLGEEALKNDKSWQ